jgi:F420-dependent oxidoreductase-like protein
MQVAVGLGAGITTIDRNWPETVRFITEAERLGVDFCWSAEAWGQDAVSPLAYVAARTNRIRLGTGVMQISARAPSMTAMTAMTMAAITSGRFVLGLGVSGPQVVEGLHGTRFASPLARLAEYLDILQLAFRGAPIEYLGAHFRLPLPGGEGKALRLAQEPNVHIPVYLATLGPKGLELTGARADGWLGTCFIPEAASVVLEPMRRGAEAAHRSLADLDLQAGGTLAFDSDPERLLGEAKQAIAFQLGAMGSAEHNFYNLAYQRAGYRTEALRVQRLWFERRRDEAAAAVPDDMAILSNFIGTDKMVKERLQAFARAGVTTVRVTPGGSSTTERLDTLARFLDLTRQVGGGAPTIEATNTDQGGHHDP